VPHGHDPLYYRYGMCDAANALLSIVGVLAALYRKRTHGEGQELWTSLMDGGAVFSSDTLLQSDGTPAFRPKLDAAQRGFSPRYRLYETDDDWIQVAAVTDADWANLCTAMGVDPTLDTDQAEKALEAAFMTKTAVMWSHLLDDAEVPNEIAIDVKGGELALFDADAERLGLVVDYEHPKMGQMRQFGHLVHFSETPGHIYGPPPLVGQHTREILEELGFIGAEQDELKEQGVVYWPDDQYTWGW
jgi:crotonobetainyl-CoA:carnitine CoA-transferase CaiB-like acyl-CoA transferase